MGEREGRKKGTGDRLRPKWEISWRTTQATAPRADRKGFPWGKGSAGSKQRSPPTPSF